MRARFSAVLFAVAVLVLLQVVLWAFFASKNLHGHAWPLLLIHTLPTAEESYLASCIAIDPSLDAVAPERLLEAVRAALDERGVELRVAPPTHSVSTGGYLDRECVEIFPAPLAFEGWNLPLIASPSVAYYSYDFNGDTVLLLQVGPRWIYLHHWSRWM